MLKADTATQSRAYKLFVRSINSPATLKAYNDGLERFCTFTSLSYDEILKLDIEELQNKLEDWVMEMADTPNSNGDMPRRGAIRVPLSGVEKFLKINRKLYYTAPLHALIRPDKTISGGGSPYTNDDIQKMLKATPKKRDWALIHFLASTGSRPAVLEDPVLRMKHLEEMPDSCYAVRLYDNSPSGYWGFLTPEARKCLDDYLELRRRAGENLIGESPLFASNENNMTRNPHLTVLSAYEILKKVIKMGGIERRKTGNRYDKAIAYAFRKRFNTILKLKNDVNSNIAEKLMNHKRGLDGTYLTPTREECFSEFRKAIPELTVSDDARLKTVNELQKKKLGELEALRKDVDGLLQLNKGLLSLNKFGTDGDTEALKAATEILQKTFKTPQEAHNFVSTLLQEFEAKQAQV